MASASADSFFVYIVECADGSLYIGRASDVLARVQTHNQGRGARWTACRRPVKLVYHEEVFSEMAAIARERQLKGWTHAKKVALISGDIDRLKKLAKRRIR